MLETTLSRQHGADLSLKQEREALNRFIDTMGDGCDLFKVCRKCPFPRCRYDDPGYLRRQARKKRSKAIRAARRKGAKITEMSERFQVSERTILRVLAEARTT